MAISVFLNGENFEQVTYNKEDDFEQLVAQNAQTIFGDKAIYIDTKKKVSTSSLGGAIPDGFLIDLSDADDPQFYLVEVELQAHDFFAHILPQINKFITSCKNPKHRQKIVDVLFSLSIVKDRIRELIGSIEVYKFLKDTIDSNQNILIIIDGSKAEFREMMDTHTDTWGRMVKVQIVNHFRRNDNDVLTVEPPFQNIAFEDAVSPSPDKEILKPSQYTEEFHLQNRQPQLVEIYKKLKQEFIHANNTLQFRPVQNSIGVRNNRRCIAAFYFRRKKLWLDVMLPENAVIDILKSKYHKVRVYLKGWCSIEIFDTDHWNEIQNLITTLVEKHQET